MEFWGQMRRSFVDDEKLSNYVPHANVRNVAFYACKKKQMDICEMIFVGILIYLIKRMRTPCFLKNGTTSDIIS